MYDAIVLGTGGVGSAALYHLARRGAHVLGIDRFPAAHDRGSSHGMTRIIRQAYFEHPDYVPLLRRAYQLWHELTAVAGEELFVRCGVLQVGPEDGVVVPGVLESARLHGLDVEQFTPAELTQRFPGFTPDPSWTGVLERNAGYLRVERCVHAHLDAARAAGAELQAGVAVQTWRTTDRGVEVVTDTGTFAARKLVIAAGAWAGQLLQSLNLHLTVLRKSLFWFQPKTAQFRLSSGCPGFLFETPAGVFYGFPQEGDLGVKIAEHSGGKCVDDPLALDRSVHADEEAALREFCEKHAPGIGGPRSHHVACMYTMSPDTRFIVDLHPNEPRIAIAAGLSGHGFKFASVLGEILADLALEGSTGMPIEFLSAKRKRLFSQPGNE